MEGRRTLVFDVEADNLLPICTTIWVVCTKLVETGEKRSFRNRDELVAYVREVQPTHVVFHNGLGFDLEALARVRNIPYTVGKGASWMDTPVVWVDTLLISRFLNADRVGGHSLEAWGERLGFQKGDHSDWSQFSEDMLRYCERDVDLTEKVLEYLEREMEEYDKPGKPAPQPIVQKSYTKPAPYQGESETYTDPYRLPEYE